MDEKVNNKSEFRCKVCNKEYASKSSLCNHIKKFHNNDVTKMTLPDTNCDTKMTLNDTKKYNCCHCNKTFNFRQNKYQHEKKCKLKDHSEKSLQETIIELKKQVAFLLQEKGRIHHKTLQKINNQLTNITNNNTNNTNNTNNGTINNTYVNFGSIDYEKIFTPKQICNILKKNYKCIEESIKQVHFNENLPEYNNIFITNLRDNIGYVFNNNKFVSVHKKVLVNDIIGYHAYEIDTSLDKYKNKLPDQTNEIVYDVIKKIQDDNTPFIDHENNKIYNNYKSYKQNELIIIIYNKSDKNKFRILNSIELHEKKLSNDTSDDESTEEIIV